MHSETRTRIRLFPYRHVVTLCLIFAVHNTVVSVVHAATPKENDTTNATALVESAMANNHAGDYGAALDNAEQALALTNDPSLRMQAFNEKGLALFRSVQEAWDTLNEPDIQRRVLSDAKDAFLMALISAPSDAEIDGLELNLAGVLLAQHRLDGDARRSVQLRALLQSLSDRLPEGDDQAWAREQLVNLPEDASISLFDPLPSDIGESVYDSTDRSLGHFTLPQRIRFFNPQYTEAARKKRLQGVVTLRAILGASGHILFVEVVEGLPDGLTEAAVAALRRSRFKPATLDGKPVAVYYSASVNFRLQ